MGTAIGWILGVASRAIHVLVGSGPCCRFYPSCSQYGKTAIDRHGLLMGTAFIVRRLVRCHPWGGSGYDPVPAGRRGDLISKGRM